MKRSAFSLIELLIVIMIIGVVYTLVTGNFNKLAQKEKSLELKNLKEYLLSLEYEKSAQLLCLDDCSICEVMVDANATKQIENLLDNSVRVYRYDALYGYMETEQDVYFNIEGIEEDVCFSYKVDNLGVGEQVLVEFKDKYYDYSDYFTDTKVYNSIAEANEAKENLQRAVQ